MHAANDLFIAARAAMAKSYAPYSKLSVGASLRTADGRVHSGGNIEVASYPEGWCAETTMLSDYVMAGGGPIAEICVVSEKMDLITPCGGCRQRLAEFASPGTKVYLCDQTGIAKTITMAELLPLGFRGDILK
ncbi:MAG: cytidine deaminase [Rhizobiaceae bacterium]|nr:cytidine deaminase [Rhizobiaceae bacterium]